MPLAQCRSVYRFLYKHDLIAHVARSASVNVIFIFVSIFSSYETMDIRQTMGISHLTHLSILSKEGSMDIQIKRTYEAPEATDGYRVLVDRLWPRGIKKENLYMDLWAKTIAPSTECRKAFNHDPARFDSFVKQYTDELDNNPDAATFIENLKKTGASRVTLLYSDKDTRYNNAVVLKSWLTKNLD